jgi:hypothetical protein
VLVAWESLARSSELYKIAAGISGEDDALHDDSGVARKLGRKGTNLSDLEANN